MDQARGYEAGSVIIKSFLKKTKVYDKTPGICYTD